MAEALQSTTRARRRLDLAAYDGAAFDLDGVVTRTAQLHAEAWKALFDDFLRARAARTGEPFRPFDIGSDYRLYVDGKPRQDGARDFLVSRGVQLPEGVPDDPPDAETIQALAARKDALFHELLRRKGVEVFQSSVEFIRRVRRAGLKTAVVSASKNTVEVLRAAGLEGLFDVRVDGIAAETLRLRGKPWPDTFLQAAEALGVAPERAFGVEDALAGVQAIRAAGYGLVIGLDRGGQARALIDHGADIVAADLAELEVAPRAPSAAETSGAPPSATLPASPTADPAWRLVEAGFDVLREHEVESCFAIGNGFMGARGSLMEGSAMSSPATFVAGLFDCEPGQTPELMRLPDWTRVAVTVDGQPLRLDTGENLEHRRILDMRQAILWREWRRQDAAGRITRMAAMRFASAADRRLLVQSASFTPENYSGPVTFTPALEGDWTGRTRTGEEVAVALATRWTDPARGARVSAAQPAGPQSAQLELGRSYRVDRIIAVHTSRDGPDPARRAREHAAQAVGADLADLAAAHARAWEARWADCDVRIAGDPEAQRALRFAVYHLLSAADPDDPEVSIGARALTGASYRGHVFWDTEIFMAPFFTLTFPEAARALLTYRGRTLPAARARAAASGWRGAFYAWESARTGEDVTPAFVTGPTGEVLRVLTGQQEQHISADVAYGVWSYWRATGDEAFLLQTGAEILLETARFWASRAEPGDDGLRHIRGVIGPDEYHETVDDNAYTNGMARWNLRTGAAVAELVSRHWPAEWRALAERIGLAADEPRQWDTIARELYTGLDEKTGLIEQFRGYFGLEDIRPAAFEPRNAPIDVLLGHERLQGSQIIKQADVLMLLHLLWDDYPPEVRAANFRYYEPRCAQGSSLSPSMHALIAARLGDLDLATAYFRQAMEIDLSDTMGNAAGGVHAAALGGLWQAAVFGFAGVELGEDGPRARPNLPPGWERLAFQLKWRGRTCGFDLTRASASDAQGTGP